MGKIGKATFGRGRRVTPKAAPSVTRAGVGADTLVVERTVNVLAGVSPDEIADAKTIAQLKDALLKGFTVSEEEE